MNIYHWIAIIFLADALVFLPFIRGASDRIEDSRKRKMKMGVQ